MEKETAKRSDRSGVRVRVRVRVIRESAAVAKASSVATIRRLCGEDRHGHDGLRASLNLISFSVVSRGSFEL